MVGCGLRSRRAGNRLHSPFVAGRNGAAGLTGRTGSVRQGRDLGRGGHHGHRGRGHRSAGRREDRGRRGRSGKRDRLAHRLRLRIDRRRERRGVGVLIRLVVGATAGGDHPGQRSGQARESVHEGCPLLRRHPAEGREGRGRPGPAQGEFRVRECSKPGPSRPSAGVRQPFRRGQGPLDGEPPRPAAVSHPLWGDGRRLLPSAGSSQVPRRLVAGRRPRATGEHAAGRPPRKVGHTWRCQGCLVRSRETRQ
jgi:hypothetical protein